MFARTCAYLFFFCTDVIYNKSETSLPQNDTTDVFTEECIKESYI